MRKLVRFSSAAAASGLFIGSALSAVSKKGWDLRDRENRASLLTGGIVAALIWVATLA